jgi:hypothetical protein
MSNVTPNLKLNKFSGNLALLDKSTRDADNDANLDAIDAAIGALQPPLGIEIESGDGAIGIKEGTALITKGSAAALTLAAPMAGSRDSGGDDGKKLKIVATTAYAHTVTTPANKINSADDTVTYAAVGDFAELVAYGGIWYATLGGPTPASLS